MASEIKTKITLDVKEFESLLSKAGGDLKKFYAQADNKIKLHLDDKEITKSSEDLGKKSAGGFAAGFGNLAKTALLGAAVTGIAVAGKEILDTGMKFQSAMADFSALTGVSGKALDDFGQKAQELSQKFGGSAIDQVTAFKGVLSRFGPDLAKAPEALTSITESINTLAKAGGLDAVESMDAITTAALQFGVDLKNPTQAAADIARMMNVMAAGAKEGAAEIPQVKEAITVAGVAAKGAKVSFEETNAAIQVLAAGGKYGAEAGTALRNVLGKLGEGRFLPDDVKKELKKAGVDINKLTDNTKTFSERLGALGKISKDTALMTKMFGSENAAAGSILVNNAAGIDELTKKISGTQTAYDQAKTNMNTFAEAAQRSKAAMETVFLNLFKIIEPSLTQLMNVLNSPEVQGIFNQLAQSAGEVLKAVMPLVVELLKLTVSVMPIVMAAIKVAVPVIKGLSWVVEQVVKVVRWLVDGFVWLADKAIKVNIDRFNWLYNAITNNKTIMTIFNAVVGFLKDRFNDAAKQVKMLIDGLVGAYNAVVKFLGLAPDKEVKKQADAHKENAEAVKKGAEAMDISKMSADELKQALGNLYMNGKKGTDQWNELLAAYSKLKKDGKAQKELLDEFNKSIGDNTNTTSKNVDKKKSETEILNELNKQMADLILKGKAEGKAWDELVLKHQRMTFESERLTFAQKMLKEVLEQPLLPKSEGVFKSPIKETLKGGESGERPLKAASAKDLQALPEIDTGGQVGFLEKAGNALMSFGDVSKNIFDNFNDQANKMGESFFGAIGAAANAATVTWQSVGKIGLGVLAQFAQSQVELLHAPIVGLFASVIPLVGPIVGEAAFQVLRGYLTAALAKIGFKQGGYTGDYDVNQEVGVVHGREFVFNEQKTRENRALFEHIQRGGRAEDYNRRIDVKTAHEHSFKPLRVRGKDMVAEYEATVSRRLGGF